MTFVHPAYLWLLVLGLTPVAIYYLLRFRSLRVNWGANYVLELALARLRSNWNWAQIVLMALRILACMALVLVFARPASRRAGGVVTGSGTHHILIIDGSYSMFAGPADPPGQRRWDRMMSIVKQTAGTWGRGEKWSLCFVADKPRWVVEGETVESPEKTIARLDALKPGETTCLLSVALGQVAERAGKGKVELFIAADDQATTWAGVESLAPPAGAELEVYWIRPGNQRLSSGNLAVIAATPISERVLTGHPTLVAARVKSFADRAVEDINLDLLLDGALASRKVISLQPGQELETSFELKVDRPGAHHLEVQLPADDLDFDNRQVAAIEAVESLKAVVQREASREGKLDSVWGFLEVAERGRKLAAEKGDSVGGAIVWSQESGAAALASADVVILDAGSSVSNERSVILAEFVRKGGGLVVAGDASIDAAKWNAALGGSGLLPVTLGSVTSEPVGGDKFRSLLKTDMTPSALRLFETQAAGDWSQARFYAWRRLDDIQPGARVVGVFDDQSPWAVLGEPARGVGLGRVLVLATGLAGRGGNLVVREFFVPLLHQCVLAAAAGHEFPRTIIKNEHAGGSLRLLVDASATGATFARQGGELSAAPVRTAGGVRYAEIDAAELESGLYNVMAVGAAGIDGASGRKAWFGVQGPRVDSDLTPVGDAAKSAVVARWGITEVTSWTELEQLLGGRGRGSEWQHWVILSLVLALFCEMTVQRVFSPRATTVRLGSRATRRSPRGGAA